jgi:hypothetical protein
MDIRIVKDGKVEEDKPIVMEETDKEPVVTGLTDEYIRNSIGALFDLKPTEISLFQDKIGTLLEYARSMVEDPTPENIKWAIRSLQGKVGTPPLGEKWINYLGKYCYLKLESMKLNKETEKYEKNI